MDERARHVTRPYRCDQRRPLQRNERYSRPVSAMISTPTSVLRIWRRSPPILRSVLSGIQITKRRTTNCRALRTDVGLFQKHTREATSSTQWNVKFWSMTSYSDDGPENDCSMTAWSWQAVAVLFAIFSAYIILLCDNNLPRISSSDPFYGLKTKHLSSSARWLWEKHN